MRTLTLAGAAALAFTIAPAALVAQDSVPEPAPESEAQPATPLPAPSAAPVDAPDTAAEANAQATTGASSTEVIPAPTPDQPDAVVTTHPGNLTAPPQAALNKTYPVCRGAIQDSCQNPGEGGAPGRSRALGYWPGEPASERTETGG